MKTDTIVAPATPMQPSAIGVIRLSGPDSLSILRQLVPDISRPKPRYAYLRWLYNHSTKRQIDQVIIIYYRAPNSYTGEDMVEFFLHGSPAIMQEVIHQCIASGGRMAAPGEFTQRALLNGKIDLIQAEAIADLTFAQHSEAAYLAARQLYGEVSDFIGDLQDKLLDVLSVIHALVDFPDDDVSDDGIVEALTHIQKEIEAALNSYNQVRIQKYGIRVVLAGPPNAGKSTLFNRLLNKKRSITADLPGTTRDVIEERVLWEGIPIILVDIGGIGDTKDPLHEQVQEIALQQLKDADIVVSISTPFERSVVDVKNKQVIEVMNKIDLFRPDSGKKGDLEVSAINNTGIEKLQKRIVELAKKLYKSGSVDSLKVGNDRHFEILQSIYQHVVEAKKILEESEVIEVAALELEAAIVDLGELSGSQINEQVLDRIFNRFCIGK